jgi:hypothetical protein
MGNKYQLGCAPCALLMNFLYLYKRRSFMDNHPNCNLWFNVAQIDDVISQAQTTRQVLGSQRAFFGDVQGKVKHLSDRFPIIRGVLGTLIMKQFLHHSAFLIWFTINLVTEMRLISYRLLQVRSNGGDRETLLFYQQSLLPVRCFLSSIGFQNN